MELLYSVKTVVIVICTNMDLKLTTTCEKWECISRYTGIMGFKNVEWIQ
jgi:hypothetical protein